MADKTPDPVPANQPAPPSQPPSAEAAEPPKSRLGVMNTIQEVRTDIPRRDVLEHPLYNRFKTIMTFRVALPAVLIALLGIGSFFGLVGGLVVGWYVFPGRSATGSSQQPSQGAPKTSPADAARIGALEKEAKELREKLEKKITEKTGAAKAAPVTPIPRPRVQPPVQQPPTIIQSTTINVPPAPTIGVRREVPPAPQAEAPQPRGCEQYTDDAQRRSCERWSKIPPPK